MKKTSKDQVSLGRTVREVMTAWAARAADDALTVTAQYLPGPKHELAIQLDGKPQLVIREEAGRFIGSRDPSAAEADDFFDALGKGQVEIVAERRLTGAREVLHDRSFEPLLTDDQLYDLQASQGMAP